MAKTQTSFTDNKTGIKAHVNANGYLHIEDAPILRSGIVDQSIKRLGFEYHSQLTNEEVETGIVKAYRSAKEIFSKKTMQKFLGIPVCIKGRRGGPYEDPTALYRYTPDTPQPEPQYSHQVVGTLIEVHRGKGKDGNTLYGHIVIWDVHAFLKHIVKREPRAIAPAFRLDSYFEKHKGSSIVQKNLEPNMLYLEWGDAYGFDILDKGTLFRKWIQTSLIKNILPAGLRQKKSLSIADLQNIINNKTGQFVGAYPSIKELRNSKKANSAEAGDYAIVYNGKTKILFIYDGKKYVEKDKILFGASKHTPSEYKKKAD